MLELNEDPNVPVDGVDLIAIGMGKNGLETYPKVLQGVTIKHVTTKNVDILGAPSIICAGRKENLGACLGNSGCTLVHHTTNDVGEAVLTLVGVTYLDIGECKAGEAGGYASVSHRVDWIKTVMCSELNIHLQFVPRLPPPYLLSRLSLCLPPPQLPPHLTSHVVTQLASHTFLPSISAPVASPTALPTRSPTINQEKKAKKGRKRRRYRN